MAGDKITFSDQGIDFWLIKLSRVPTETEGGDAPTDGEPLQTLDMPGLVQEWWLWACWCGCIWQEEDCDGSAEMDHCHPASPAAGHHRG